MSSRSRRIGACVAVALTSVALLIPSPAQAATLWSASDPAGDTTRFGSVAPAAGQRNNIDLRSVAFAKAANGTYTLAVTVRDVTAPISGVKRSFDLSFSRSTSTGTRYFNIVIQPDAAASDKRYVFNPGGLRICKANGTVTANTTTNVVRWSGISRSCFPSGRWYASGLTANSSRNGSFNVQDSMWVRKYTTF